MCGIVGVIAERNVVPILLHGLKRLEYRGYDSAGIAVMRAGKLERIRREGKVAELDKAVAEADAHGPAGIAHTRWATHGPPRESNAHPHLSGDDLAVVHNGIVENFEALRSRLSERGYDFSSETDTEVVAHLVHLHREQTGDLLSAVQLAVQELEGAYALAVISVSQPDRIVAVRRGSPLVIGLGLGENYVASDQLALLPVTTRFIYPEEGEIAEISREAVYVFSRDGKAVDPVEHEYDGHHEDAEKGDYRHFMLKEIHEQPAVLRATLDGRIASEEQLFAAFGADARELLAHVGNIQIVACGTSYHAGMVARYWLEAIAGIPCQVEVASEFRYRQPVVPPDTLLVTISQSGETADTLAALRSASAKNYMGRLAICNVDGSSLTRESRLVLLTRAGPEIGVASTKAFTTQLAGLSLLVLALARVRGMDDRRFEESLAILRRMPGMVEQVLALDEQIREVAGELVEKHHALFLGRGPMFPIAMEGALKLKEISYIHAEAYPAGELKHGPLALVDQDMPVIAVAPKNDLLEKLKSNLQEVRARGGRLFVFADRDAALQPEEGMTIIQLPAADELLEPMLYTLPLQLLSYHVAVLRGTDVDQPRNLAKSVTVE